MHNTYNMHKDDFLVLRGLFSVLSVLGYAGSVRITDTVDGYEDTLENFTVGEALRLASEFSDSFYLRFSDDSLKGTVLVVLGNNDYSTLVDWSGNEHFVQTLDSISDSISKWPHNI